MLNNEQISFQTVEKSPNKLLDSISNFNENFLHVNSCYSSNDSDVVIPSLPCSGSQPVNSRRFLMDGLGTKHRVRFQRFGTSTSNHIELD